MHRTERMQYVDHDDHHDDDEPTQPISVQQGAHVLVAEDDAEMRRLLAEYLARQGYTVHEADSGRAVLETFQSTLRDAFPAERIDLLVTDVAMPGMTGLEALRRLRAAHWGTPTILVTAFPDRELIAEARRLGVPILSKPFSLVELARTAVGLLLARDPESERGRALVL